MTLTWVEDGASRSASIVRLGKKSQSTYVKSYKIFGSADDVEVHNEINTTISGSYWQYPGAPDMQLMVESYSLSYLGDQAWQLSVQYTKDGAEDEEKPDPLHRSRSFDTSGGTKHITQARSETRYGPTGATGPTPNMNKAIGVDGQSVAGVDIVVPQLQWSENYDVPDKFITSEYIKKVAERTGTVNDAGFRSFAAGEVLFIGCSGSHEWDEDKGSGPWNLAYKFVANPNAGAGQTYPAETIGAITGVEKKGHEYMWIYYDSDVTGGTLLKKPKYVYINEVYRKTDFAALGIGVT